MDEAPQNFDKSWEKFWHEIAFIWESSTRKEVANLLELAWAGSGKGRDIEAFSPGPYH